MEARRVRTKSSRGWVSAVGLAAFLGLAIWQGEFLGGSAETDPQPARAITAKTIGAAPAVHGTHGTEPAHDQAAPPTIVIPTLPPTRPVAQQAVTAVQPVRRSHVVLLGTTITDDGSSALVSDIAGAPSRVLRKGDQVDGLQVTEIRPDRLLLSDGVTGRQVVLEVGDEVRAGAYSAMTQAHAPIPSAAAQPNAMSAATPPPAVPEYTEPSPSEEDQPASSAH